MKKILYILTMAVVMMFASCQKDADVVDNLGSNGAVAFSAESISPLTKVSGTSWNKSDAIGITMLGSDNQSVIYDNYKYLASEDGKTVSFTADSKVIYFAEDGAAVDFIAYYPYQKSWSYEGANMLLDISGQDGTAEEQDNIDLLISTNCTAQTEGEQKFQFTHALSKVQISVSNYDDISAYDDLSKLTATIYDVDVEYDATSMGRVSSSATAKIEMVKTTTDDDNVLFTAIITPGVVNYEIIFTDGEKYYSSTLSISGAKAGKRYNFSTTVGDLGLTIVELTGDGVTDWGAQDDSVINTTDMEIVDDVCQIYTAAGLKVFANLVNGGETTLNAKLMNNIDLEGSVSNPWSAIGTSDNMFGGTFDGGGFEVSGLYQSGQTESGFISAANGAVVQNLTVSGEISCVRNTAGVVSYARSSTVISCHNNVDVTATSWNVGGVVGYASGSAIVNCYNSGDIISNDAYIGGIVGYADDYSVDLGSIINCYNVGAVSGSNSYGAIAGWPEVTGEISNCYYLDSSCTAGRGDSNMSYDYITSMSSDDMKSTLLLYHLNNGAYTYNQTNPSVEAYAWKAVEDGYPTFDTENDPTYTQFDIRYDATNSVYQIYSGDGMRTFADLVNGTAQSVSEVVYDNLEADVAKYFDFGTKNTSIDGELMNDIDLGGIDTDGSGISGSEFSPIGTYSDAYSGEFDGGGFKISGLYIDESTTDYQALFSRTSGATIKNLAVRGSVIGQENVGGIVAYAHDYTKVTSCYSEVAVTGAKSVGGIVGYNYSNSTVENCYNRGVVTGCSQVGGIVGLNYDYATVKNCFNTTKITYKYSYGYSAYRYGGIIGFNWDAYAQNCYYDSSIETEYEVIGYSSNAKAETNVSGKSTDDMTGGTFAKTLGSAFMEDSGSINDGYPILTWQATNND